MLHKAAISVSGSYNILLTVCTVIGHSGCVAAGSYRTCIELVLKHFSAVRLVRCAGVLCHVGIVSYRKEIIL